MQFNALGHLTNSTFPLGQPEQQSTTFEIDPASGARLSVTDALGRQTAFGYDANGNRNGVGGKGARLALVFLM